MALLSDSKALDPKIPHSVLGSVPLHLEVVAVKVIPFRHGGVTSWVNIILGSLLGIAASNQGC